MIPWDKAQRLQAWVDGELSQGEAREMEAWLQRDGAARELAAELRGVAGALRGQELPRPVPETREFYWSQIRRAIERESGSREERGGRVAALRWHRWLWPVGAGALVLGLVLVAVRLAPRLAGDSAVLAVGHEVESPLENVDLFTFRSESARMTVVWVDFREN